MRKLTFILTPTQYDIPVSYGHIFYQGHFYTNVTWYRLIDNFNINKANTGLLLMNQISSCIALFMLTVDVVEVELSNRAFIDHSAYPV